MKPVKLCMANLLVDMFHNPDSDVPYYGLEGVIYVDNLSFRKKVGFRVSDDGWGGYQDIEAYYDKTIPDTHVELWKVPPTFISLGNYVSSEFSFAVYYHNEDDDIIYWDNNCGKNYCLKKSQEEIEP
jgi:hypothetical protein